MLNSDTASKKITKAYNDYMARKSAKNRLNLLKAKKKYANLPQNELTQLVVKDTPLPQYKSDRKTFKPKQGGLMTNLPLRARDLMIREIKQERKEARELIGNKILAYNYKKDYSRELKLNKEIITKKGKKTTVREILREALLGKSSKFEAKKSLRYKNIAKLIEEKKNILEMSGFVGIDTEAKPLMLRGAIGIPTAEASRALMVSRRNWKDVIKEVKTIAQQRFYEKTDAEIFTKMDRMKNKREGLQQTIVQPLRPDWSSIVKEAVQGGLDRLVEYPAKLAVAQYIAEEAVPVYEGIKEELALNKSQLTSQLASQLTSGRRITLAEKLGLEERFLSSNFGSERLKKTATDVLQAVFKRENQQALYNLSVENMLYIKKRQEERGMRSTRLKNFIENVEPELVENNNILPIIEAPINQQMPRNAKGSQEARDFMARIRGLKKPRRDTKFLKTGQFDASTPALTKYNVRRRVGRPKKTPTRSPEEIATYMMRAGFGVARPKITRSYTRKTPVVSKTSPEMPKKRGRPPKLVTLGAVAPAPVQASKKGPRKLKSYAKVLMSVPRAVSTGNGAVKRRGRPNKLTTDTARVVKDVLKLQGIRRLRGG